jgi:pSer/pThr/pTyr-binding forkhead associated (FHA) protein
VPHAAITTFALTVTAGPFLPETGSTNLHRTSAACLRFVTTLSARHFEVENREGRFSIRDLSSTNGTKVNGHLLNQTVELRSGDRIEAGQTIFVFRTLETVPWTQPHHQGADHDQTT